MIKRNMGFFKVFTFLLLFAVVSAWILGSLFSTPAGDVVHLRLVGEITSDSGVFSSGTSSTSFVAKIEEASLNPGVKAILIEINSPGGSAFGSKEISEALSEVDKPKVCWLRETAASGAYWIASECDEIVADEFTLTGSLSVYGSYLEFSEFMEEYGIGYVRLVSGDSKDTMTPYRKPTSQEKAEIQEMIDYMGDVFINDIADNRNLSADMINEIDSGTVILGKDAINLGLVDVLGGEDEALELIKRELNVSEIIVYTPEEQFTFGDLFGSLSSRKSVPSETFNELVVES